MVAYILTLKAIGNEMGNSAYELRRRIEKAEKTGELEGSNDMGFSLRVSRSSTKVRAQAWDGSAGF